MLLMVKDVPPYIILSFQSTIPLIPLILLESIRLKPSQACWDTKNVIFMFRINMAEPHCTMLLNVQQLFLPSI